MRIAILVAAALSMLLVGGTCLPLVDTINNRVIDPDGRKLAIALRQPTSAETLAGGETLSILWTGSNLTGDTATVSISVESRDDLSRTTLVSGIAFVGTSDGGEYRWDTTGFSGPYAIILRIATANTSYEETGPELITIDAPPTFAFRQPTADVTFESGDSVTIAWFGGDDGATTAEIGLDPDGNHTTGNEVIIHEPNLPNPAAFDSFEWTGNDSSGSSIDHGTYYLYATVSDEINPEIIVESDVLITIVEEVADEGIVVVEPAEDVDFVDTDDFVTIEYRVNKSSDVLVDVKLNTDNSLTNGNEITIDSQRLVEADTDPDPFEWDGTDSGGDAVPDGIYEVFISVSTGGSSPQTATADGLVYRRTTDTEPLIGLLDPSGVESLDAGDYLVIEWRDDDPGEEATIRITLDDDDEPNSGEDGSDPNDIEEIVILEGRAALGDDVQDTFTYQIPGSLDPGTYYIFAYIDQDGAGNVSIAGGRLVVSDPAGG